MQDTDKERSGSPRVTRSISTRQAKNLLAAFDHAERIDCPLNTHVIIHWAGTANMAARVPDRIQLLLARMRHWLDRRNVRFCHIWAQEPSRNSDVPHMHLLVHVPHVWREAFEAQVEEWVDGIGTDNAMKIVTVRQSRNWHWREYLVKGVNPKTRDEELRAILKRQRKASHARGPVEGKRCGVSQNTLGPAARAAWEASNPQYAMAG